MDEAAVDHGQVEELLQEFPGENDRLLLLGLLIASSGPRPRAWRCRSRGPRG
jgi:hypothetical protein